LIPYAPHILQFLDSMYMEKDMWVLLKYTLYRLFFVVLICTYMYLCVHVCTYKMCVLSG
jgi:hypothetical protein